MTKDNLMLKLKDPANKYHSKRFNPNHEWFIPRDRVNFYLTHDFHPYFAAFPPQLVARLLHYHSQKGDTFLDPFMGGGTSMVEGVINARRTIGNDISPFSKFVSSVKSTPVKISSSDVSLLLSNIRKSVSGKNSMTSFNDYDRITNVRYWFDQKNLTELDSIYRCIEKVKNKKFRDFALLAFSSILRKSSNAKNAEQHLCLKKCKRLPSPLALFERKMSLMSEQMGVFYKNYGAGGRAELHTGDVRELSSVIGEDVVDIVITSPPYGTGSKYTNIYRLSYEWLGLPKPHRSRTLETTSDFRQELKKALGQIHRVLKPGKFCFFVYGNPSTADGLTGYAIKDAESLGFRFSGTISCPIKKTVARHSEKYTRFIPKDFVIILQKQS